MSKWWVGLAMVTVFLAGCRISPDFLPNPENRLQEIHRQQVGQRLIVIFRDNATGECWITNSFDGGIAPASKEACR